MHLSVFRGITWVSVMVLVMMPNIDIEWVKVLCCLKSVILLILFYTLSCWYSLDSSCEYSHIVLIDFKQFEI